MSVLTRESGIATTWPRGTAGLAPGVRVTPECVVLGVRAGVTPKVRADGRLGQWNRFEITMKGDRLTVVLNGQTVIENAQLPGIAPRGPIALQHHGDEIQFANIYIKNFSYFG